MKIKYYLRGLGIGLILSTIILTISKPKISDKEIIKRAKKLGMVMDDYNNRNDLSSVIQNGNKTDIVYDEKQIDDKNLEVDIDDNEDIDSSVDTDNSDDIDDSVDIDNSDNMENKDLENDNNITVDDHIDTNEDIKLVKISITQGMYSSDVARILFDKGVIDDKYMFDKYMIESNQAEVIDTGEYDIPIRSTFEEIAKIITR
ncbi:MAG TPA: endolytic transglycosylase MltG [Clostridiales bacterium]|nr:endolytic transglycosylase MltG [Clostridiales bacterium]